MAEETQEQNPPENKGGGGVVKMLIALVLIAAAAGGGFATYSVLLAPMLADAEGEEEPMAPKEYIPVAPVPVEFPEDFKNVIMDDPNIPASTLLYGVTLECNNQLTADLIAAHMARFVDMVATLHESRLRSELNDMRTFKKGIQSQIRQKANDILRQVQAAPSEDIMVTNVYHRVIHVEDKL